MLVSLSSVHFNGLGTGISSCGMHSLVGLLAYIEPFQHVHFPQPLYSFLDGLLELRRDGWGKHPKLLSLIQANMESLSQS